MIATKSDPKTWRIKFLLFFFFLAVSLVVVRLFFWQVVESERLERLGRLQYRTGGKVDAERGSILAADNFPLAASVPAWLAWAQVKEIKDPKETAKILAPFFAQETDGADKKKFTEQEQKRLESILTKKDVAWVPLKQKVTSVVKEEIEKLGIAGVGFDQEEARTYPEASLAAQLLGFVGKDQAGNDKGYFGLEGRYDVALSGREGKYVWEKDALGNPILTGDEQKQVAVNGVSLKLHLVRSIQFIAEKYLAEGLQKYGAQAGTVIVMRPQDGAILAMASTPSFDPASFSKFSQENFVNPAISMTFEPGSIFKILVMSAALDARAVTEDMKCDSCTGPRRIAEYTIRTWNDKYFPNSSPADIIQHSDNIGMIWVAEKLGSDKLWEYLNRFGIGRQTGIDLQGESVPQLLPKEKWNFIDLATASFGQGIAVTPIQMVQAVAAIANSGRLPTPHVVDKIVGDGWEEEVRPVFEENVISGKTAQKITEMMINAVANGEAKWAAPKDFLVAGKTGTAQIPVSGHYDAEKTIASFIGFAPAGNPAFVMLVTLREPKSSPWASETAAPLWFSIAKEILTYLGTRPYLGVSPN